MQQVVVLLFSLVALSLASQSYLIAVASNCSIVTIDVGSGQYKVVANIEPSECPSDPMDSISAAGMSLYCDSEPWFCHDVRVSKAE